MDMDVTEAQSSFPLGILVCGYTLMTMASSVPQSRVMCHYQSVMLTSPSRSSIAKGAVVIWRGKLF